MLRSKRAMLCKHMKIDSANLKWYAAFHNESHHPHVHLLVYSVKDGEGYLTKQSIEAMRSELAHDIFRQDFANIYEEQAQSRMDLKERSEVVMKTWIDEIRAGTLKSSEIETSMMQLSKRLQNTGGKKVYGYLKRDVKDLVDHIVDELEKDDRVSALYREWGLWQDEIVKTYRKQTEELPPLSKQPKLKSIKNMVIAEALRLGSHHFLFEENEDGYSEPKDDFFIQEPNPVAELTGELDSDYAEEELMAEKKNPVPTGGQMDIYRLGIICMAAILHYRILKRHIRSSFRKQSRGMGLPCTTLVECLRMAWDGMRMLGWHRNGMRKHWKHFL